MAIFDTIAAVVHLIFAGLWTGSVLFFVGAVLPLAREGELNAAPLSALTDRLTWITRISALLLLLTGGHIAAQRYTAETLTAGPGGHLVLTMVALWAVLAAVVEIGASRLQDGFARQKVREPARDNRYLYLFAAVVAVALLVDAGMLMA